jgi:hypothetical protein
MLLLNNIPHTEHTVYAAAPRTYYNIRTIHHIAVNHSLTFLKMGKKIARNVLS